MKSFNLRKVIPGFAIALVIIGIIIAYSILSSKEIKDRTEEGSGEDTNIDMPDIAQVKDQFKIENKNYIILSEEQKIEFGFPSAMNENDIGDRLITITTSVDADLIGSEVYYYLPAGAEAVVAVKTDNEYNLFKFFTFDSYNNNQDEDVSAYLELYGINSEADIAKIQFIGRSEEAKIEGKLDIINEITYNDKINGFYKFYSVIKNSSDNYFDKLFNYKVSDNDGQNTFPEQTELPADQTELPTGDTDNSEMPITDIESDTIIDKGDAGASSTEGFEGTTGDALNNSVTIRIYNQNGIYFDAEYYPNLGFISRHEVNTEFTDFLKDVIA